MPAVQGLALSHLPYRDVVDIDLILSLRQILSSLPLS